MWTRMCVANGLIPVAISRRIYEKTGIRGKFVIYEFGNAWNPKGPGEATRHHLLPSGTVYAGHYVGPRFVKNCPETLVPGLETPAHRKLLGKYRNRPRGRNISKAFFSKHFCAFEGPSLIISHVLNSANIENINFERLLINYRGFEIWNCFS